MQFEWSWHKVLVGEPVGGLQKNSLLLNIMIVNYLIEFSEINLTSFNTILLILEFYKLILPIILINYFIFSTLVNIIINNGTTATNINVFSTSRFFFNKKFFYVKL